MAGCTPAAEAPPYPGGYLAGHGPTPWSAAPVTIVAIPPFGDAPGQAAEVAGRLVDAEGQETVLTLRPTPAVRLADALGAVLRAAGHRRAGDSGPAVLRGEVQAFGFEPRPDGPAVLRVRLAVRLDYRGRSAAATYAATCGEAGAGPITDLAGGCIGEVARQFAGDASLARLLSGN